MYSTFSELTSLRHDSMQQIHIKLTQVNCMTQVIPTPLTRLWWWRVCLDEAQMVESSTAKAAEMASKLAARHRWCITGTPLSRGLEDLYGLFYFLKAAPLSEKFWWNRVCQRPYEAGSPAGSLLFFFLIVTLAHCGILFVTYDHAACSQQLTIVLVSLQSCCREVDTIGSILAKSQCRQPRQMWSLSEACCTVKNG